MNTHQAIAAIEAWGQARYEHGVAAGRAQRGAGSIAEVARARRAASAARRAWAEPLAGVLQDLPVHMPVYAEPVQVATLIEAWGIWWWAQGHAEGFGSTRSGDTAWPARHRQVLYADWTAALATALTGDHTGQATDPRHSVTIAAQSATPAAGSPRPEHPQPHYDRSPPDDRTAGPTSSDSPTPQTRRALPSRAPGR